MLIYDWGGGHICLSIYMHISAIRSSQVRCSSMQDIYTQLEGADIGHRYMCIVLYIHRSAISCAKFGVAVSKASMFELQGGRHWP